MPISRAFLLSMLDGVPDPLTTKESFRFEGKRHEHQHSVASMCVSNVGWLS
jgi:hypothetical protein